MKRCLIIGALLVSAVTSFASPIGDTFDQTRKNWGEPTYARDGYFIWYHADTGGCTWVKYSSEDFHCHEVYEFVLGPIAASEVERLLRRHFGSGHNWHDWVLVKNTHIWRDDEMDSAIYILKNDGTSSLMISSGTK